MATLIIVDVQNDFTTGSLATASGPQVARAISDYVTKRGECYEHIVATKDWHIDPGSHFSETPDFVDSWPVHCRAETPGAEFDPGLTPILGLIETTFTKGEYAAAYSGFEGADPRGASLAQWLRERGIAKVDVVGIATDHCVRATALDGLEEGFEVRVLSDLVAAVDDERGEAAIAEILAAGGQIS